MVRTAACLRGGGQATSPDPRHRPQSSRVHNIGAQVARGSTVPAGRGCFPCRRLGSYHQPAATSGGLGGNNTAEPRTPTTWPGSCGSGAPRPGWSRALLDIYLSHNERHQSDCSHYICSSRPLSGSAPAWVKASPRCPTHRLRGAVTMGSTGIPLVGRTRRVGGHLSVALSFKHCEIGMKINAGPSGFEPETAGFLSMRR